MITRTVSVGVAVGMPGRDNTSDLLHRADEAVLTAKRARRQPRRGVQRRHVPAASLPQRHRTSPARRNRQRSAAAALSARGRPVDRRDRGGRGARSVAASDLGTAAAGVVHRRGRIRQPGRGIGPMGDAKRDVRNSAGGVRMASGRTPHCASTCRPPNWSAAALSAAWPKPSTSSASTAARCAWRSPSEPSFATSTRPARTLEELKEVGVQIAIDDFGTGYAVLSHLKSLPVDTLKIDTSFVRDLGTSSRHKSRVFSTGAAQLARLAHCPIISCVHTLESDGTIVLEWGVPICVAGAEARDDAQVMDQLLNTIEIAVGRDQHNMYSKLERGVAGIRKAGVGKKSN